ncbi:hypothetical protein [Belnapia rosea]|uniref:Uncharacterized protein n=1 Tax=Belnapia rosea TaxID=938405 RepID=A0A1G7BRV5_9PROT|nr:hypothetical protein [Belnapia rosea]SDE28935.1 hypothetical protein SAMN04487779_102644 [Belnapia rosea]
MRLALSLAAASTGLFALVAVVLGDLCCPPAGFVAHFAPTAAVAAALDSGGSAERAGEDR